MHSAMESTGCEHHVTALEHLMTLPALLGEFLLGALAVILAGVRLARDSDVIAARSALGRLWVGSVFLAAATSLPEMTTDIAAVRLGAPNLAIGDLFGSSMANMLVLALVALVAPRSELFRKAALDHTLYAALAIVMSCLAAIAILMRSPVSIVGIGPGSFLLLGAYLAGSRAIFRHTSLAAKAGTAIEMSAVEKGEDDAGRLPTQRRAWVGFALASLVILVAAPRFAHAAAGLADYTGLGTTFFGTWIVGFATSLPELVTSLAAVRLRAYDLAVGNLFGSNALNMVLVAPLDIAHGSGPVLAVVSTAHVVSALVGVVLMALGVAALVSRAKGRFSLTEPSSAIMVITYLVGVGLLYLLTGRL